MPKKKGPLHILEAQQFDRAWLIREFFPEVSRMKRLIHARGILHKHADKTVCLLFYEPSTRTRISFEQAAYKLGAKVASTENALEFSSAVKGETMVDTMRVINALQFDAVVIRAHYEGAAKEAASVATIPVLNAGDGGGQHPTQALLDIYTIFEKHKKIDNLSIALVGDLKNGRTTRSLAYLLGKFKNVHFELIAPKAFQMKVDILEYFDRHNISYTVGNNLEVVADKVDVVYLTRLQKERMNGEPLENDAQVGITQAVLQKLPKKSIIMHPLPRSDAFNELPEEFTHDPHVVIFDQVENGLYVRMALLDQVLR